MGKKKQSPDDARGELLPPRELMSLIDPGKVIGSGVPGASGPLSTPPTGTLDPAETPPAKG
jgi:hypothetical protein